MPIAAEGRNKRFGKGIEILDAPVVMRIIAKNQRW
jgi:hypothetical protein